MHGTAAPTRHAHQQSPWHSAAHATHATRPTPIPTACHCVPRHSAAHATRPTQPAAAFQETSAPSFHPQVDGFPAPATISQHLTREHAPAQPNSRTGSRNLAVSPAAHDSLRLPRKTMPSEAAPFPTPASRNARCVHASPRRPRESTFATPPVATFPDTCHVKRTRTNVQNARFPTPATRIHPPVPSRARTCIWSPTPATRNARPPCVHATRPDANPHDTAPRTRRRGMPAARPRHARDTPDPRSLPRETHVRHACTQHAPTADPDDTAPRHARGTPQTRRNPRSLPRETHVLHVCTQHATNPIPTARRRDTSATRPRHASNTPDPRSLPRENDKNVRGTTRRRSQRTRRHSESVAPSRIPAQGHGFEKLVVATPPP